MNSTINSDDQRKFYITLSMLWISAIVILLVLAAILGYIYNKQTESYKHDLAMIVDRSALSAAHDISREIQRYKHHVKDVAEEEPVAMSRIYESGGLGSSHYQAFKRNIQQELPELFTYAISNASVNYIVSEFKGGPGKACEIDIIDYVKSGYKQEFLHIHSHPTGLHIDIMTTFISDSNEELVFFVGILADEFLPLLQRYANPGFSLLLVDEKPEEYRVIRGDEKYKHTKENSRIADVELENVILKHSVPGTNLFIYGVIEQDVLGKHNNDTLIHVALLYGAFFIVLLPIFYVFRKQIINSKNVFNQLIKSEAKLFDLYEYAPDMYVTVDEDTNILSANKNAREFFNQNGVMEQAMCLNQVIDEKDWNDVSGHINDIFQNNNLQSEYECKTITGNGEVRYIHARFRLNKHYEGDQRTLRIACRDVTQQKLSEIEELDRLERQRDVLVQEVHHRIKNNLQSVASLLKRYSRDNPEIHEIISDVNSKISSIAEAYGLQSKSSSALLSISNLVNAIIENEQKMFLTSIKFECDESLQHYYIAQREITPFAVIISELITNAIKYSKPTSGGGKKSIFVYLLKDDDSVKLKVINEVISGKKFIDVENKIGLGQGLKLIRALLPPKGTQISHIIKQGKMEVCIVIEPPNIESKLSDNK